MSQKLADTDAERGTLIHKAFELLSGHPDRANLLFDAVEMTLEAIQADAIISLVAGFVRHISFGNKI